MIYKDYYKDLGVRKSATQAEIKKAFRAHAKKFHPDKTRGDTTAEEKFKTINEANEVLSDPVKRKKYDQFGADWKRYEEAGAQPGGFDWSKFAPDHQGRGQWKDANDSDASFAGTDDEDFFELLFGQHNSPRRGRRNASSRGQDLSAETILSFEESYHGATRLVKIHGQTIKVTIKPGIAEGQVLKIAGKGGVGTNGGVNGNVFFTVRIHPGTQNGKELRLRGLGMPVYGRNGEFGDLTVTVDIVLPQQLSEKEDELFRSLAAMRTVAS